MNAREYIAYLNSPAGQLALRDANRLLTDADPETDDTVLLAKVMAIGFPKFAALRVFNHCTGRYAPLECRKCKKQFRPKARSTVDRPWCHQCVKGPRTPEQQFKDEARRLATIAESSGKIRRQPCATCGTTRNLHKHHPDYSRPLYVIWLCAPCHRAEHKVHGISRETSHASH